MLKRFLPVVLSILPHVGLAQDPDYNNWVRFTDIEIDVSVENLLEPVTAVIIGCTLESDTPAAIAGSGYTVLYQDFPDSEGVFQRVDGDVWLDWTNFQPVDGLKTGGLHETVNVPIYGNKVDLAFWTKGECLLALTQIPAGEMEEKDWTAPSPYPVNCSDIVGDGLIYAEAWTCVADDYRKTIFNFTREELEAGSSPVESQ